MPQYRVGYLRPRGALKTWATRLDLALITHVNLCFAAIDGDGNVSYDDAGLPGFVAAAHAKGVKVCISLGGGGTGGGLGSVGSQIAPAKREAFADKIASYTENAGLDCVDVDFEGSGVNQDYEGFVSILGKTLRARDKQLTAALASWYGSKVTSEALQAFDFVNVMAYDLHNPAGTTKPVQGASLNDAKKEVDYWVGRGLDKKRAVLGLPFYGYRWTSPTTKGEAVTFSDILKTYGAAAAAQDEIKQGATTVYLDSKATVQAKVQLAREYAGTMIWELSQDADGDASLLRAMGAVK